MVSGAGRSPTRRCFRSVRPRSTKPCGRPDKACRRAQATAPFGPIWLIPAATIWLSILRRVGPSRCRVSDTTSEATNSLISPPARSRKVSGRQTTTPAPCSAGESLRRGTPSGHACQSPEDPRRTPFVARPETGQTLPTPAACNADADVFNSLSGQSDQSEPRQTPHRHHEDQHTPRSRLRGR
jgi:hypothetical protein